MGHRVKKRKLRIRPNAFPIDFLTPIGTRSGLEKLPPELYAQLLRHMKSTHGVLLSLTCKNLWSQVNLQAKDVLYRVRRCTELDETIDFLTLLEKDSSYLVLCTACLRLHRRLDHKITSEIRGTSYGLRKCSDALGQIRIGPFPETKTVPREAVELVLRAALEGPKYGLSTECLRSQQTWEVFGIGRIVIASEMEGAMVVSDSGIPSLVLKITYSTEIDHRRSISEQVNITRIKGCGHDIYSEKNRMTKTLEEVKGHQVKEQFTRTHARYRCAYCPMDMYIRSKKRAGELFANLKVNIWRDLGPRGDHGSKQWQAQSSTWTPHDFDRTQGGYLFALGDPHGRHSLRGSVGKRSAPELHRGQSGSPSITASRRAPPFTEQISQASLYPIPPLSHVGHTAI